MSSDAVALLGMLSVMNEEKRNTVPKFASRSPIARRSCIPRLLFCLSITSLAWWKVCLASNLLLLALKCNDCQHGRPQKFFQGGGQSRHFAYPFQVVDDATQIDIHKTKIIPNMSGMSLGYSGDFPN